MDQLIQRGLRVRNPGKQKNKMSFSKGNIEINETELIVSGYYFCFGSCSVKRVKLDEVESVEEIITNACNSKTCGQACTPTWWHCDPHNGCLRECKNMRGLVVKGKNFSVGLTLANDNDYEEVKKLVSPKLSNINVVNGSEK